MRFSIKPRVLEHLGRDLITSDEVAIVELIKNAYDAEAFKVGLHFIEKLPEHVFEHTLFPINSELLSHISKELNGDPRVMILEDTGNGMTYKDLENGFFTIGTDVKKKQKNEDRDTIERLPFGEKGIGRLAAHRLGNILFIETTNEQSDVTYLIKVNWGDLLNQDSKLEEIEFDVVELPKHSKNYTRLWFLQLNVDFNTLVQPPPKQLNLFENETKILLKDDLASAISFLLSPFDNDFKDFGISIFLNNLEVSTKFENDAIEVSETQHAFVLDNQDGVFTLDLKMTLRPWYIARIHRRLVGEDIYQDLKIDPSVYQKLLEEYSEKYDQSLKLTLTEHELVQEYGVKSVQRLKDVSPIAGTVYAFKREAKLSSAAINSAKETGYLKRNHNIKSIKTFLDAHNGIKLYRGKFRVTTLGDKNSDWLELQQARTKGQQFFRFELGNVIGYINVHDPYQEFIKEISSRQDLAVNAHSKALRVFLKEIFNTHFYHFSQSAFYLTKNLLDEKGMLPTRPLDKLKEKVDNTALDAEKSKDYLKEFDQLLNLLRSMLQSPDGINSKEMSQTFESLSSTSAKFRSSIGATLTNLTKSQEYIKQVENEKRLIELESYNNYKLMANGLVTEVLTHELHSILSNFKDEKINEQHFNTLKDFLVRHDQINLYTDHLYPIYDETRFIQGRVHELKHFYAFLEKTFLYNGTKDDFQIEDILVFIQDLENRLSSRLKDSKVTLDYTTIDLEWEVPRGVLIHIFYNLIDNSIYWIKERRKKQKQDKRYNRTISDVVTIKKVDENTIHYWDSGTGVYPRMDNQLFYPLVSGKESGRGMGLYIVRKLLRSFGGDIELLKEKNEYGNRYIFAIYRNAETQQEEVDENE